MISGLGGRTVLIGVAAALWVLAAGPAYLIGAGSGIEGLTYAVIVCLIPGYLALEVAERSLRADRAMMGMLVGMGVRMAFVLIAVLVCQQVRPDLQLKEFHIWLVVAYMVMLAAETGLLLSKRKPTSPTA